MKKQEEVIKHIVSNNTHKTDVNGNNNSNNNIHKIYNKTSANSKKHSNPSSKKVRLIQSTKSTVDFSPNFSPKKSKNNTTNKTNPNHSQ